jgi:hypothetical protein
LLQPERPGNQKEGTVSQVAQGQNGSASPTSVNTAAGTTQTAQTHQIDPAEFSRLQQENASLQREAAKVKGMQPFVDKARSYGFDKAESFDQIGPLAKFVKERGIDTNTFMRAFEQSKQEDPNQSAALTIKDVQRITGETVSAAQKEWIRDQAKREFESGFSNELKSLSRDSLSKLAGEDAPDSLKDLLEAAAIGRHVMSRKVFPEGHPLAGEPGLAGDDGIADINKFLTERVTGLRAHQWKKLGAAARNPSVSSTTAGSGGNQGEPKQTEQRKIAGVSVPPKEEIQAAYDRMKAGRSTA